MDVHELLVLQMAQERIENAVRAAQQRRAVCPGQVRRSARVRLGSVLVRLGQWMIGER